MSAPRDGGRELGALQSFESTGILALGSLPETGRSSPGGCGEAGELGACSGGDEVTGPLLAPSQGLPCLVRGWRVGWRRGHTGGQMTEGGSLTKLAAS